MASTPKKRLHTFYIEEAQLRALRALYARDGIADGREGAGRSTPKEVRRTVGTD